MEDDELPSEDGMAGRGPLPPAQRCRPLLHLWGAHRQRGARSAGGRSQHALTSAGLVPQRCCPPAATPRMDVGTSFPAAIPAALPLPLFLHSGRPTSCGILRAPRLPRAALQPPPPPGCTETGQSQGSAAHRYVRIGWMWCHLMRALKRVDLTLRWADAGVCSEGAGVATVGNKSLSCCCQSAVKTLYRSLLFSTRTHTHTHLNWQQPASQLYKKYLIK